MNCIHTTAFYPQKVSACKQKSRHYLEKSFRTSYQVSNLKLMLNITWDFHFSLFWKASGKRPIPLGCGDKYPELFSSLDNMDLISPETEDGNLRSNMKSHLSNYMKDYVTYAFWITLLFILVLTLGTIANTERDGLRNQGCYCPNFARVCPQCNNQTWFNVPLSWDWFCSQLFVN